MFYTDCLNINSKGNLTIGECDVVELAKEYGTPLYVISEDKIRDTCRRYKDSFNKYYNGFGTPIYASKALSCKAVCKIIMQEGLDLDIVSGGELYTALSAGFPADKIHFHGNNKTLTELSYAIDSGVGEIVADNLSEIREIERLSLEKKVKTKISLRIKPGIDAHTHEFIKTGQIDSKFGFALETGEALEAVKLALGCKNLCISGLHCHIGSQITDVEPFVLAARVMLRFYKEIKEITEKSLETLNLGGGFGTKYLDTDDFMPYENYMGQVSGAVREECSRLDIDIPKIYIEPGRSVVAEAGITLYTVGNIKEIPGVRNYVSVDGGMGDNPRYALYKAPYTCLIANKAGEKVNYKATIAGKYCESGDVIQENIYIQAPKTGDIMAVLSTGAYNYSMASNYNRNPRPPMVLVSGKNHKIIIKGESYEDLLRNDM